MSALSSTASTWIVDGSIQRIALAMFVCSLLATLSGLSLVAATHTVHA